MSDLLFDHQGNPAAPSAGQSILYPMGDNKWVVMGSDGIVRPLLDLSYQSIVTAAGTTTLTKTSPRATFFTGSTTQNCDLPDATTLFLGDYFEVHNNSTGVVTVRTNGGATLLAMAAGTSLILICTSISTAAGTWDMGYRASLNAANSFSAQNTMAAGTTTIAPVNYPAGVVKTSLQAIGDHEFDGAVFYKTIELTAGRGMESVAQIFRLTADGSAIGPAITDYFGATSSINLPAAGVYEITFYLWWVKTTGGTVLWTITNSAANYTNIDAWLVQSALAGIGTSAASLSAGILATTAAAAALPVSGAVVTATNQYAEIRAIVEMNAAGNIRLRVTSSAGTITPKRGSYYTVRRLAGGNVGNFVA